MTKQYKFNRQLYSKEALFKAAYQYIDDFYLHLDCTEEYYIVDLETKQSDNKFDEQEFVNEMLINETRRIVNDRTGKIRELMYARAMATTVIGENTSEGEYSEADEDADDILVDWFEENE
jgi:His-Xaa-Ser system protein HxsD